MTIIEVKNLSKKYIVTGSKGQYDTLREKVAQKFKRNFYFLKKEENKHINDFWALNNVDLKIEKGEIVGIIGANGSGKSTLLKIISGITTPTIGEVVLRGKIATLLEVGTGFDPELTGRENIYLSGVIMGMSRKEIESRFYEIVNFSGINDFLDTPVKKYSSGMYVRLAFSVAAHMEPDILLIDEVLAVGDAAFQRQCIRRIKEDNAKLKRTVLFVSHNLNAVRNLCDKCILLNKGEIEESGETIKVVSRYSGGMNGKHDSSGLENRNVGDKEIVFKGIDIKNQQGLNFIQTGDDVFVNIKYESSFKGKIKNVQVLITIYNEEYIPVLRFDNTKIKNCFNEIKSEGKIICKALNINLVEGEYFINVAIFKDDKLKDFISEAIYFKIINNEEKYNLIGDIESEFNKIMVNYNLFNE